MGKSFHLNLELSRRQDAGGVVLTGDKEDLFVIRRYYGGLKEAGFLEEKYKNFFFINGSGIIQIKKFLFDQYLGRIPGRIQFGEINFLGEGIFCGQESRWCV